MPFLELFGAVIALGAEPPRQAENDNWGVCSPGQSPAEAMQLLRRMQDDMRQELRADFRLRSCPQHRQRWELLKEIEKCARWHLYGERG